MFKSKKIKNYQLQLGNMLLTVGYNFVSITDMPNKLVEHTYRAGSVEYAFLNHLLSPVTKDENGDERQKTKEELQESKDNVQYLSYFVFSTELFFVSQDVLKGYNKLLEKIIHKQKVKKETDTTAISEEADFY